MEKALTIHGNVTQHVAVCWDRRPRRVGRKRGPAHVGRVGFLKIMGLFGGGFYKWVVVYYIGVHKPEM